MKVLLLTTAVLAVIFAKSAYAKTCDDHWKSARGWFKTNFYKSLEICQMIAKKCTGLSDVVENEGFGFTYVFTYPNPKNSKKRQSVEMTTFRRLDWARRCEDIDTYLEIERKRNEEEIERRKNRKAEKNKGNKDGKGGI